MSTVKSIARNQSGAVLAIVLLVLLALTILGAAALSTTSVELNIARNERELREAFYLAEGAAMEGVQRLVNTPAVDLDERFAFWHHSREAIDGDGPNFRDPGQWEAAGDAQGNCLRSPVDPDTFIAAVEWRVAPGGSLVMTGTRLYQNRVYGRCTKHGAEQLVEIGYYLRY